MELEVCGTNGDPDRDDAKKDDPDKDDDPNKDDDPDTNDDPNKDGGPNAEPDPLTTLRDQAGDKPSQDWLILRRKERLHSIALLSLG